MSQTDSYGFKMDFAQAGQKVDLAYDHVEGFAAEGTVPFGVGLVAGTDAEKQAAVPEDDSGTFIGVSLFTHRQVQGIDQDAAAGEQYSSGAEYRDHDTVNVLRRGRVYVEVTEDVSAGDDAYVDVTTSGEEGKWTNVDTSNLSTGGVFRTGADTGELAVVEINLP